MDNADSWLSSYTNNLFETVPSPAGNASSSHPAASEASPIASTSTASASQEEAPRSAVKDRKRRACDACRIRRIRCQRTDSRLDSCDSCMKMDIRCVESKPKVRTTQKGARIAQAKLLFGDASSSSNALSMIVRNSKALQDQSRPRTPSATEVLMVASVEAGLLLSELVPAVAKLKIAKFPMLRWIEIAKEFEDAKGRLSNMDKESQALFLSLAALSARTSHSELVVGPNAPTLRQVSVDRDLRQGVTLCAFGKRRERVASELLQTAYRKINENQLLATPSLRSVAAITTVEMLILAYQDSLAFTRSASRSARPLSAAAASHLRILAEESNGQPSARFGFYSVAWTAVIRDALVSSVTGRALEFTSNDIFMILKVNEEEHIDVPSPDTLMQNWLVHPMEGPKLMQLWACILKAVRKFVNDVTQPLAAARARLNIQSFDRLYSRLKQCRESFAEALILLQATAREPPEQKRILQYSMDFMLAQAHRIVSWRCSEEQLARAREASTASNVASDDDFEVYKSKLQMLRMRSGEEAFQAARRVMGTMRDTFATDGQENAEFFVPGYFIYEGLLVWASLLIDTRTLEEGGRIDYSLLNKIDDLTALRDGIAVTGWSSGSVEPHLERLGNVISSLEQQQHRTRVASSASFFSQYVDMSPVTQSPSCALPTPHHPVWPSVPKDSYSYQTTDSGGNSSLPTTLVGARGNMQGLTPAHQWLNSGMGTQSNFATQASTLTNSPGLVNTDQLPSAEHIDQFLRSIGFSNPLVDSPYTSSL